MDQNKLKVLRDIGYEVKKTCRGCKHADISPVSSYGYCAANTYQHVKHGGEHFLSIHEMGCCPKWERAETFVLDKFEEFLGS